jgi:hypothetical protein
MPESKVHYVLSSETGYTFCGRYVSVTLQVTRKPRDVSCTQCLREAQSPDRLRREVRSA